MARKSARGGGMVTSQIDTCIKHLICQFSKFWTVILLQLVSHLIFEILSISSKLYHSTVIASTSLHRGITEESKNFLYFAKTGVSEAKVAGIHLSLTVKLHDTESMHQMLALCIDYSGFVSTLSSSICFWFDKDRWVARKLLSICSR